jgi:NitT/TauT family transport system substrate-binding protein
MVNRRMVLAGAAAAGLGFRYPLRAFAQSLEKVTFRFNWSWIGNYAPVVLGRERGYFQDLGIDLILGQGKGSGSTVRQAGAKNDMFVWADTSALLVARAQGVPIMEIMVLAVSNLGVLWIDGRTTINSARDLIGKKVSATPGDGNTQMWPAVLAANNMKPEDVEMVYVDGAAAVAALREGRVDASFGGASDQPVTLRNAGVPAKFKTYAELGVATLGSGVITHVDTVKERPDLCRKVVAGVQRSWAAAIAEPEAAVQALLKIADMPLNENVLRSSLQIFLGLQTGRAPIGLIEPAAMETTLQVLKQYGGIKTDLPATAFYTNEFVAKS